MVLESQTNMEQAVCIKDMCCACAIIWKMPDVQFLVHVAVPPIENQSHIRAQTHACLNRRGRTYLKKKC